MKKNKKADTIAGIIIAVFILWIALVWILNILNVNTDVTYNYEKEIDWYILKSNSDNILKKVDTSNIEQWETFYIYKDTTNKQYSVLTWATNEIYKYVDKDWNHVLPEENTWKTFIREYVKNIDILRYDIKPPEIENLVFHFDATNIDWSYNSTLSDNDNVTTWLNLAWNWVPNAVQRSSIDTSWFSLNWSPSTPIFKLWSLNGLDSIQFSWNEMLAMERHPEINNDEDNYAQLYYDEKSIAVVFRTSDDVNSRQIIYEQWWSATGYNFMIKDGDIWASVHNYAVWWWTYSNTEFSSTDNTFYFPWDNGHESKSVNLWEALPNTVYFITIVQDSTHMYRNNSEKIDDIKEDLSSEDRYIDDENKLKIYLNWYLVDESSHVDVMPEHSYWWIGNVFVWNVDTSWGTKDEINDYNWWRDTAYFRWEIWELISRNHALSDNEIRWVQNYFTQKWLGWKKTIRHDIIDTNLKELKEY